MLVLPGSDLLEICALFRKNIGQKIKKIYSDTVIKKVEVHLTLGPYKFFFAGYRFLLFSEALDKNFRNLSTKFHANRSSIKKVIKEKQKKK